MNFYLQTQFLHNLKNPTIVDFGANIGLESLKLEKIWPKANFILVEPDPGNCDIMRSYTKENWTIEQCAVDLESGEREFGFEYNAGLYGRINGSLDPFNWERWNYEGIYKVKTKTPKEICSNPDIIKMDIERQEYKVLPEVCKLNPKILYIELHGPCYDLNILSFLEECIEKTNLEVTGWYRVYQDQKKSDDAFHSVDPMDFIGCGDFYTIIMESNG